MGRARRDLRPLASAEALVEPRIHVITLGVDDVERALAFYRGQLAADSAAKAAHEALRGMDQR
jgi:hypothetical protein